MSIDSLSHLNRAVGERIRAARLEAKLSQYALSRKIGIGKVQISRWENGHSFPSDASLAKLASALRVDIRGLYPEAFDEADAEDALGARVRQLRRSKAWTLRQMADEVGISYPVIWEWENGTTEPKASSLRKLVQIFHVSSDYLLFGENENVKFGKDSK